MKITIYFLLGLILIPSFLFAQLPQDPLTALSPNASSLGSHGDIAVSLYTGRPEIIIPLYEIKGKHVIVSNI